jgi:hypothetical protein
MARNFQRRSRRVAEARTASTPYRAARARQRAAAAHQRNINNVLRIAIDKPRCSWR